MKNECAPTWGAVGERGKITAKTGSGGSAVYTVSSIDRDGLDFTEMKSQTEVAVNDLVCFFGFSDGTGRILYKL